MVNLVGSNSCLHYNPVVISPAPQESAATVEANVISRRRSRRRSKVKDMRFCCPNCGRDEEILLDRKPLCRFCRVEMIEASSYSELWMSPHIAIKRMATISETYGIKRARVDGRFKKEREAWTTGVLALALSQLKDTVWWVEIETVDNTPDTKLQHIDQSSGHNVIQTRCIEIVDWEENVADIMEVIAKKCGNAYPGHYLLVVNARHGGKVLDFDRIIEEMKRMHSPFLEIWVVASIGRDQVKVVRVAPGGPAIDLNLRAELEKARKQPSFLKRGIRGMDSEFRDLGPAFLPIP